MPLITKETFKQELPVHKVSVPEVGADAYVLLRELRADEVEALRGVAAPGREGLDRDYELLWQVLVDDTGKQVFDSVDEMKALFQVSFNTFRRLLDEVLNISGIKVNPKN